MVFKYSFNFFLSSSNFLSINGLYFQDSFPCRNFFSLHRILDCGSFFSKLQNSVSLPVIS